VTDEKREAERLQVHLDVRWEHAKVRREGTISDLSATGCFILASSDLKTGETIRIVIEAPRERPVPVLGEVVYVIDEMGFALRFLRSDKERENVVLAGLLERLRASKKA
jgi:hypothetical protein